MLSENIRSLRKSKGLSQEELAVRLNVVRQTVSKWETGLSVPDADALIGISEALETPVSALLGESAAAPEPDELRTISEKLEVINFQLAQRKAARQRAWHLTFVFLSAAILLMFAILAAAGSPYLGWNYSDPERMVAGVGLHIFEWLFVRAAPVVLCGTVIGALLTRSGR